MSERPVEIGNEPLAIYGGGSVSDFVTLLKPRVMSLVVFTALVGLVVAPGNLHPADRVSARAERVVWHRKQPQRLQQSRCPDQRTGFNVHGEQWVGFPGRPNLPGHYRDGVRAYHVHGGDLALAGFADQTRQAFRHPVKGETD